MLEPSMQQLMKKVGNRYLLVNLAAQRARDIAEQAEREGEQLPDKAVKLALDEIVAGKIVYCPGARVETAPVRINNPIAISMVDVDEAGIDEEEGEEHLDEDDRERLALYEELEQENEEQQVELGNGEVEAGNKEDGQE